MEIRRVRHRAGALRGRYGAARPPQIVTDYQKARGCERPGCAGNSRKRAATGKTGANLIHDAGRGAMRPEIASNRVEASSTRRRGARSPPSIERRVLSSLNINLTQMRGRGVDSIGLRRAKVSSNRLDTAKRGQNWAAGGQRRAAQLALIDESASFCRSIKRISGF